MVSVILLIYAVCSEVSSGCNGDFVVMYNINNRDSAIGMCYMQYTN